MTTAARSVSSMSLVTSMLFLLWVVAICTTTATAAETSFLDNDRQSLTESEGKDTNGHVQPAKVTTKTVKITTTTTKLREKKNKDENDDMNGADSDDAEKRKKTKKRKTRDNRKNGEENNAKVRDAGGGNTREWENVVGAYPKPSTIVRSRTLVVNPTKLREYSDDASGGGAAPPATIRKKPQTEKKKNESSSGGAESSPSANLRGVVDRWFTDVSYDDLNCDTGARDQQPPCAANESGDPGVWVCRTLTNPFTGVEESETVCASPESTVPGIDKCGCCQGRCPPACVCPCNLHGGDEDDNGDGSANNEGDGVLVRVDGSSPVGDLSYIKCADPRIAASLIQFSHGTVSCVDDCGVTEDQLS